MNIIDKFHNSRRKHRWNNQYKRGRWKNLRSEKQRKRQKEKKEKSAQRQYILYFISVVDIFLFKRFNVNKKSDKNLFFAGSLSPHNKHFSFEKCLNKSLFPFPGRRILFPRPV